MGWSNDEEEVETKKNKSTSSMETSTKLLIGIIICILCIIAIIIVLLNNIKANTYSVLVDGTGQNIEKSEFIIDIDGVEYINISKFSSLVGYEYHNGEYKAFTIEDNRCYVENENETATFYLNENKVYKSPKDDISSDYQKYETDYVVKEKEGVLYAAHDAINIAFNVMISETDKSFEIYTLDYMVNACNKKVTDWGYTGLEDLNFENQKAVRYGYLIVQKESELYKIIDDKNNEIVTAKYSEIQFSEATKEFFVTNSLGKVGIITIDGKTKIEPIYTSISVLDNNMELYLVEKDNKFGVIKSGNKTIVSVEYDKIGIDSTNFSEVKNRYIILDTLIPVYQNNKWGAYDINGNLVIKVEYDNFGCNITQVKVNDISKTVNGVLIIEKCEGIVVELDKKYGVINIEGKELVPIAVSSIYSVTEDNETNYYMIYNDNELNIIERLEKAGLIKEKTSDIVEETEEDLITVDVSNTTTNTLSDNKNNIISDN